MTKAIYRIAEQSGNLGVIGEIELYFEITAEYKGINILIPDDFKRWYPGVLFGATYWIEHNSTPIGLNIEVQKIEHNEVDTNNTIISYLTFHAIENAGIASNKGEIIFNKEIKSFVYKK